jgi:hypothetical protein
MKTMLLRSLLAGTVALAAGTAMAAYDTYKYVAFCSTCGGMFVGPSSYWKAEAERDAANHGRQFPGHQAHVSTWVIR